MKRRIAGIVGVLGTAGAIAVPAVLLTGSSSANAAGVCVHLDVNINGTAQTLDQCLPPA